MTNCSLDEELWKLIQRQFEVVDKELTSRGFITMHEAQDWFQEMTKILSFSNLPKPTEAATRRRRRNKDNVHMSGVQSRS